MWQYLQLAQALQVVFDTRIEFTDDCFVEFTEAQYASYEEKVGPIDGPVYRVVLLEPTLLDDPERGSPVLELPIVSEKEKSDLVQAVAFVHHFCQDAGRSFSSFGEKLDFLAPRLPRVITGG